jgi:hypothetical protein
VSELRAFVWRLRYRAMTGPMAVRVALATLRLYERLRGPEAAEGLISLFERRYVYSGWPYFGPGWTNMHLSRFVATLRRRRMGGEPVMARRQAREGLPRIACVGRFVGLLGFPKVLMDRCPVELVVADLRFNGRHAGYLRETAHAYEAFDLEGNGREDEFDRLAAFVNGSGANLVLNIGTKPDAFEILRRLDAPCIANYCAGSDLLHHPAVDLQYHGQPEADYFVVDGRMFCGTTRRALDSGYIHTITGYIDPRGLAMGPPEQWAARRSLIVCHGSLAKFSHQPFLDVLCGWLADDGSLDLVLMGRDAAGALQRIRACARRHGVEGRMHYEGEFSAVRDAAGVVADPGWQRLVELLGQARMAPNPFPIGGGSARFEAYALGAPSVHLAVRFDPGAWGRRQPGACEIPSMLAPLGTATSVDDYRALGRRCLADGTFADRLALEQLELARRITDADRWWGEILDGYERWRTAPIDQGHRRAA